MARKPKKHEIVRILGEKKRIYGGWERRDKIQLNGTVLRGYIEVRKEKGILTEYTCYFDQTDLQKKFCFDPVWLAHQNGMFYNPSKGDWEHNPAA
jgi:pyridoxal/pyridoxine/pyridoxamine kinase